MGHDYYPEWLDNLADDVILEAAAMDGHRAGLGGRPFNIGHRQGAV
jgi:hypothetical protein